MSIFDTFQSNVNHASTGAFTFTIQFGTEKVKVEVRADDPTSLKSLDAALKVYGAMLGYDFSRPVNWRRGNEAVNGSTVAERGETYVASVSHEQKG